MSAETEDVIVVMDAAVREVLREFDDDPIALAAEVVALREEVSALTAGRTRLSPPFLGFRPPDPPDAPVPIRMFSSNSRR